MKEIARAHGLASGPPEAAVRAFRHFLADTINKHGSMYLAAKELGLAPAQLNNWANYLEIERRVRRSTAAYTVATLPEKAR